MTLPASSPLYFLLSFALLVACGGAKSQELPPPGVEITAEPGAEDGANKPVDGKISVTDAELKAAAKRAKQAAHEQQVARGRKSHQTQRERERDEGKDRDTEKESPDLDGKTDGESTAAKPVQKALPRNPNPPSTVPAPSDVAAAPVDAARTPSGVWHKIMKPGTGTQRPSDDDMVVVHYTGWTTDGKMFDSSVVRGVPVRLSLGQVIQGWRDGVRLMVPGETRRLWIPEHLAYQGRAGAPRGMLVFDVELLDIESP
jgi:FKBP-type peptidyl-prolyl cis-trans isomerase